MGQKIKRRRYWRKKTTRGMQQDPESIWIDIARRTAKTFVQVTLGVIGTLIINPPEAWKPAITAALATGVCAAMNYAIKRIQTLIGDPDRPETKEEDTDDV